MSLATRAVEAYEAQQEEERLRKEAADVRRRSEATQAILREAEVYGMEIDPKEIVEQYRTYTVQVPVDENLAVNFSYRSGTSFQEGVLALRVEYADELYRDRAPGDTSTGGTYGHYSLTHDLVTSLESLGALIVKGQKAREAWAKKHGVKS